MTPKTQMFLPQIRTKNLVESGTGEHMVDKRRKQSGGSND